MVYNRRTRQKLEAELAVHLKKGRLERAALILRVILEKDPDDDRLFVKLADVSLKLGDVDGVRAAFRGAAAAAERKGFYLRAMAALRQLARHLPPPQRPWTELSNLAFRLGLPADALGFLDEGTRAWAEAGDRTAVLQAARRAHALVPDDVHRTLRLAHELRSAGWRDEALALLAAEAARHRDAGRAAAWLQLADEQSSIDPTSRALACEVASAHLDRGEPRKALQRLQALIRERAQHVDSLRLLVRAFDALGQPTKRLVAVRELARTLSSRSREAEARVHWQELVAANSSDAEARRALGLASSPEAAPPAPLVAPPPPEPMIAPRAPTPLAAPLAAALAVEPEEEVIDLRAEAVEVEEDFTLLELEPEAPLEAPAAARATHADLEDDLAHADFLVVHRFAHEARALLDDLEAAHPGHPGVTSLRARLDAGPERIRAHTPAPAAQATPALQLATPPPSPAAPPAGLEVHDTDLLGAVELVSAEEVLARFQEQVALAVSPGDAATHYDLGIAYREMGLVTEALAEFEQALGAATGPRAVDCLVAVALCQSARGEHAKASRTLKRALAHPAITRAGAAAVLYELGAIRERAGDATGAASAYRAADRSQPHFRDAAARAERLQPGGGSPGTGPLDLLPSGA